MARLPTLWTLLVALQRVHGFLSPARVHQVCWRGCYDVAGLSASRLRLAAANEEDEEEKPLNPYADPNYPDLEFINYDDPEYQVDQGDEYFDNDNSSTEEEIEAMREERRRRNDEFQFQTYFRDIWLQGEPYFGEWMIYEAVYPSTSGALPQLKPATGEPLKVTSRAVKKILESASKAYDVDKERILHAEEVVEDDDVKATRQQLTGASNQLKTYWPDEMTYMDFRGHQGNQCVGNAYTIATAVPLTSDSVYEGPFGEYRTEVGIQSDDLRYRIKLHYTVVDDSSSNDLQLMTLTVCREQREQMPSRDTDALFGAPGAAGGLFDPPPVGGEEQASNYMMLDLAGGATVLFPYRMEQTDNEDNLGWVTTLDWTPSNMRYQVDRKTRSGKHLLGLRTLELTEIQSSDVNRFRPRDGGADMRQ